MRDLEAVQRVVVVHAHVVEGERLHSLSDELEGCVFDSGRVSPVVEALSEGAQDLTPLIDQAQEQAASVRGDVATARSGHRRYVGLEPLQ